MRRLRLNMRPNKIDFYRYFVAVVSQLTHGSYVLDFAAAGLKHAEYFKDHIYFPADISLDELIKGSFEHDNIFPVVADLLEIPFKEGVFDLVLSTHTLERLRLSDDALFQVVNNLSKLVKKGGCIVFNYPNITPSSLNRIIKHFNQYYSKVKIIRYGGIISNYYENFLFKIVDNDDFPHRHRCLYRFFQLFSLLVFFVDMPFKKFTGNRIFLFASEKIH